MKFRGLLFLSTRYLRSKRRERGWSAPLMSVLGLTVGVLTLNAVLAVMNGFQLTFIESILEVSSYHLQWKPPEPVPEPVLQRLRALPGVRAVEPYTETQTLVYGAGGDARPAILRGLSPLAWKRDKRFARHLTIVTGSAVPGNGQVIIGEELSRALGVGIGDTLKVLALQNPHFSFFRPVYSTLTVTGIFRTGYYEIDAGWIFVDRATALAGLTSPSDERIGIKLTHADDDWAMMHQIAKAAGAPVSEFTSWRTFNAAFFGALKTEKTSMMFLVGLVFLVVGVNVFQSQRRTVQEHTEEIAIWQALGLDVQRIRKVFAWEGLGVGVLGAVFGTVLGIVVANSISRVLTTLQDVLNTLFKTISGGSVTLFSSEAFYLPAIPARVLPQEAAMIAGFAIISAALAAWLASSRVTKIVPSEVLKNE